MTTKRKPPPRRTRTRSIGNVKLLITAVGFAITLGGWGALAWKLPRTQLNEASPDPQQLVVDLRLQLKPLPTLVPDGDVDTSTVVAAIPQPDSQPELRSVNQPLNTAPARSSGSAARTRSS